MATVTPPTQPFDRGETNRRVRHPLEKLRGTIRTYVMLEGLALFVLYLAFWFWSGLLLDYGVFKAFTIDWVQEMPYFLRALLLILLLAGLAAVVISQVLNRLFREFGDRSLALVLERRFPKLLGDRLITAVELADPALAARYGYSQAMVDHTLSDAAERVDQIDVADVFDWSRLRRAGRLVAILTVGLTFLVLLGGVLPSRLPYNRYLGHCWDVGQIWFERNVLLRNELWPRQAYLEVVDFPASGELRVGRDNPRPTLRVRAIKWIIADKQAADGWRELLWTELRRPDLLGADAPADLLPASWFLEMIRKSGLADEKKLTSLASQLGERDLMGNPNAVEELLVRNQVLTKEQSELVCAAWTVDAVELQFERDQREERQSLKPGAAAKLEGVFVQLRKRANSVAMSRRLRVLEIPREVVLDYQGEIIRERPALPRQGDNEYQFDFAGLKESVRFTVRGEDYYTPPQRITLVPPPMLIKLTREEERPAYLYEKVGAEPNLAELSGKKRRLNDLPPIAVTGEVSRIDEVPAGTNLELTAEADKNLKSFRLVPASRLAAGGKAAAPGAALNAAVITRLDDRTFRIRLQNLFSPLDFFFEFTDEDNVPGRRHVIVDPRRDTPPEVKILLEVVRRTNQGQYLITPQALLPISGEVRDDHGLSQLEYVFFYKPIRTLENETIRTTAAVLGSLGFLTGPMRPDSASLALVGLAQVDKSPALSSRGKVPMATFARRFRAATAPLTDHLLDRDVARELKEQAADFEAFDLERHLRALKVTDEKTLQPHYDLLLWVLATDNNADTGPFTRESERFNLRVLSENELLVEIGKEEEGLHDKLEKAVNELRDARVNALEKIGRDLPAMKANEASLMSLRVKEVEDVVGKNEEKAVEVLRDYRRILFEMKANRVNWGMIAKVEEKICKPLDDLLDPVRGEMGLAKDALADLHKAVDGVAATAKLADLSSRRLEQLIEALSRVLDAMGEVATINKLIKSLLEIVTAEQHEFERWKAVKEKIELQIIEDALNPPDKPKK